MAAALERKAGRLIFTSTGATPPHQNLDGSYVKRIRNNYIRTKRQAEVEVYRGVERGLDAVILQPIIVVGPYDWNSYAQIFLQMKRSPLRICFPEKVAFCHAADVARAHIQAYERSRRGEHYVLGGTHTRWLEAFRLICRRVGAGDPLVLPKGLLLIVAGLMEFVARLTGRKPPLTPDLVRLLDDAPDVTGFEKWKTIKDLGYRSRPLQVMIDDCYEWLVKAGRMESCLCDRRVRGSRGGVLCDKQPNLSSR